MNAKGPVTLTARVSPDLHEQLKALARLENRSVSAEIGRAISEHVTKVAAPAVRGGARGG
jgi:predicted transcriptional regulator